MGFRSLLYIPAKLCYWVERRGGEMRDGIGSHFPPSQKSLPAPISHRNKDQSIVMRRRGRGGLSKPIYTTGD